MTFFRHFRFISLYHKSVYVIIIFLLYSSSFFVCFLFLHAYFGIPNFLLLNKTYFRDVWCYTRRYEVKAIVGFNQQPKQLTLKKKIYNLYQLLYVLCVCIFFLLYYIYFGSNRYLLKAFKILYQGCNHC